ncbi:uncharacterized protein OCT59_029203 [Rhizophagus irregularis]|uniref:Uncharacterized protein n=1 Tax=Rhizophagus irregularis (strain DAOM 197198w) TaxID=1432141 RepID=A0A015I525_RHIIW|nr:hypothetical protein RirG_255790 [Rhizophagus irregularis DAOM 197198w]UZO08961.1 hypothetical protein OCT59_029203 [Rhizophagus irregularis]
MFRGERIYIKAGKLVYRRVADGGDNGHKKLNRLKRICSNIDPQSIDLTTADFIWSPYLTSSHYDSSLKTLLKIKTYIDNQLQLETSHHQRNKIEKFINRRDNDLRSNQKRMLTSLLDRVPEKIKLDRIVFQDKKGLLTFTTDKNEIESKAIDYYSNIGKVNNSPLAYDPSKPLREEWNSIYQPMSSGWMWEVQAPPTSGSTTHRSTSFPPTGKDGHRS